MLTQQKDALWQREQKMKILKEQDTKDLKNLVSEFQCEEDDEDEEENFVWYELRDKDTYFSLTCLDKTRYQKDD